MVQRSPPIGGAYSGHQPHGQDHRRGLHRLCFRARNAAAFQDGQAKSPQRHGTGPEARHHDHGPGRLHVDHFRRLQAAQGAAGASHHPGLAAVHHRQHPYRLGDLSPSGNQCPSPGYRSTPGQGGGGGSHGRHRQRRLSLAEPTHWSGGTAAGGPSAPALDRSPGGAGNWKDPLPGGGFT